MGFLDVVLGRRRLAAPAPSRLFAITTAYVTFETSLGITSRGSAAIVFQPLSNADFATIVQDAEEVVRATARESGTTVQSTDDTFGFRWLLLHGADFDQLVVGLEAVGSSLEAGGYGERILCAVFAFQDRGNRPMYWVYNFKRGSFYPFVPAGRQQRDNERELVLKAQVGSELPVEAELERWFPLWEIPL